MAEWTARDDQALRSTMTRPICALEDPLDLVVQLV